MVNPVVRELGDVEDVMGGRTVGIDNRIRNDLLPDDGKERVLADVGMIGGSQTGNRPASRGAVQS